MEETFKNRWSYTIIRATLSDLDDAIILWTRSFDLKLQKLKCSSTWNSWRRARWSRWWRWEGVAVWVRRIDLKNKVVAFKVVVNSTQNVTFLFFYPSTYRCQGFSNLVTRAPGNCSTVGFQREEEDATVLSNMLVVPQCGTKHCITNHWGNVARLWAHPSWCQLQRWGVCDWGLHSCWSQSGRQQGASRSPRCHAEGSSEGRGVAAAASRRRKQSHAVKTLTNIC